LEGSDWTSQTRPASPTPLNQEGCRGFSGDPRFRAHAHQRYRAGKRLCQDPCQSQRRRLCQENQSEGLSRWSGKSTRSGERELQAVILAQGPLKKQRKPGKLEPSKEQRSHSRHGNRGAGWGFPSIMGKECQEKHSPTACERFRELTPMQRLEKVQEGEN
jgi:hypothetical protein